MKKRSHRVPKPNQTEDAATKQGSSRRAFFGQLGGAAAATIAATSLLDPVANAVGLPSPTIVGDTPGLVSGPARAQQAYNLRQTAAFNQLQVPLPNHVNNGDETNYPTYCFNYHKGLPHDSNGNVTSSAYQSLLTATRSGAVADFAAIPLGGTQPLVDPQAGLAYSMYGADAAALAIPPAYSGASAGTAGEMVECYWMALCRDVPFAMYGQEPLTSAAITELNRLGVFQGPKQNGQVTAQTLFRGQAWSDLIGPYVSQFFVQQAPFGELTQPLDSQGNPGQLYNTYTPGVNYMTDFSSWLAVQNGQGPFAADTVSGSAYLNDGRGLSAFVHVDELFQAYFMGALFLLDNHYAYNVGNPYQNGTITNQSGFGTFGNPGAAHLLTEVSVPALKAEWYEKWFVHRRNRPEAYGGLVHLTKTNQQVYPINQQVLNSNAINMVFANYGTYLLPMAFPEGCPQHPAYGEGHAVVAGACATIIKAYWNENTVIANPVYSADGATLSPYTGSDAGQITVGTEANKIAYNVGLGRVHAGVHWRSDYWQGMLLGEALAISILRDERNNYNQPFNGFTFTKFNGTTITV
jgi:hypothetical protein